MNGDSHTLSETAVIHVRWRLVGSWIVVIALWVVGLRLFRLLRESMDPSTVNLITGPFCIAMLFLWARIRYRPQPIPLFGPKRDSAWRTPVMWVAAIAWLTVVVTAFFFSPAQHSHLLRVLFYLFLTWAVIFDLCILLWPRRFVDCAIRESDV